jgi:hypothetical protein
MNTGFSRYGDINVNRNINMNAHNYGHHGGCCYRDHYHPIATAAAVALAVGTIVSVLPADCQVQWVDNFNYELCGDVWYQPRMVGSSTTYVVIDDPQ